MLIKKYGIPEEERQKIQTSSSQQPESEGMGDIGGIGGEIEVPPTMGEMGPLSETKKEENIINVK